MLILFRAKQRRAWHGRTAHPKAPKVSDGYAVDVYLTRQLPRNLIVYLTRAPFLFFQSRGLHSALTAFISSSSLLSYMILVHLRVPASRLIVRYNVRYTAFRCTTYILGVGVGVVAAGYLLYTPIPIYRYSNLFFFPFFWRDGCGRGLGWLGLVALWVIEVVFLAFGFWFWFWFWFLVLIFGISIRFLVVGGSSWLALLFVFVFDWSLF